MVEEYSDNIFSTEEPAEESFDDTSVGTEQNESAQAEEDYSFARWQRDKGYKNPDDLGKAYGHANSKLNQVQQENKKFREYIQQAVPWIQYAEQKYKEEQENVKKKPAEAQTSQKSAVNPNATQPQNNNEDIRETVKKIAEEMIGPQIYGLRAEVAQGNVKTILKTMREDKNNFPYMNSEVESEMNKVLQITNKSFPVTEQGIRELYNAAVGRTLPKILNEFKNKLTEEISANMNGRESSFIESDRVGEKGNVKDVHKSIVDGIVNAPYGKSQI